MSSLNRIPPGLIRATLCRANCPPAVILSAAFRGIPTSKYRASQVWRTLKLGDTDVFSVVYGGILSGGETKYLAAAVACKSSDARWGNPSTVYVRQCGKGLEVVGLDR